MNLKELNNFGIAVSFSSLSDIDKNIYYNAISERENKILCSFDPMATSLEFKSDDIA